MAGVVLAPACRQEAPDTRAADERTIRDLEREFANAAAAKDLDRFVSFYADDASVLAPNEPIVTGKGNIRVASEKMFAVPGVSLSFQPVKVEVARSGDLAYTHGTYLDSTTGPDGKPVMDKGKYVTVYRKEPDGKWKVVADIYNPDLPAAPAK